jgi:hypothetical protein
LVTDTCRLMGNMERSNRRQTDTTFRRQGLVRCRRSVHPQWACLPAKPLAEANPDTADWRRQHPVSLPRTSGHLIPHSVPPVASRTRLRSSI